mgnify:CR=1 FL=1
MRDSPLFAKIGPFNRMVTEGRAAGLYAFFRPILSEQGGAAVLASGRTVLMLGSNNYLGLSHHPAVIRAAADALPRSVG